MARSHSDFLIADAAADDGDFVLAHQAFERGALAGDPYCWSRLGLMFDIGEGVKIDKVYAMKCYRKAWRGGDFIAANNIAILYREAGNARTMFRWLKRSANSGDDDSLVELAKCFRDGLGVRRSLSDALVCAHSAVVGANITEAGRDEAKAIVVEVQRQMAKARHI